MSEVIQPAPGQSVITTDNHHRDHGHVGHHGHFDSVEARADFRSLTNEVERFGTANLGSAARTDSLVQAGFGDTSDRICAGVKDMTGAVTTGFTAEALAACKTDDALNAGFAAANTQAAAIGSAAQVLATTFAGQARDDATRNAAAGADRATGNFNLLTVQGTENTYKVLLDAQKNASADQLEAEKNHNAVMLKLCECCHDTQQGFQAAQAQADRLAAVAAATAAQNACDIKQLITLDGNTTRALINTNTIEALRSQLVATQRLIPVTIPVGAG